MMTPADHTHTLERPEPKEAFPYLPPDAKTAAKYSHLLALSEPVPERRLKNLVDRVVGVVALTFAGPLLLLLYVANLIEGLLLPTHRGTLLFSYNAVSKGKVFRKYKVRLIAERFIDRDAAQRGDWHAFASEWSPSCRTYVGAFAKKLYLDELPQIFNILRGDISIVGPRPLACHHFQRDVAQGNVFRKLIKGGLLGPSQGLKGSGQFGNPELEFQYLDTYRNGSSLALLWLDLKIACRCFWVAVQAKGL